LPFLCQVELLFISLSRAVAEYTEIKNDFMASRESLPVMFIATPKDKKLSLWTRRAPSVQVIMRPPLDAYDVLIHLNPKQVPLLRHAVDPSAVSFSRGVMAESAAQPGGAMPVIDYNPVSLYLAELRVSPALSCTSVYIL
ncbi:hypothetical protein GOODEAATRI_014682, partial [Goodea atripinnis]